MIETVDNYLSGLSENNNYYLRLHKNKALSKTEKNIIGHELLITLNKYQEEKNNKVLSFFKDVEKVAKKNEDALVISLIKKEDETYNAQTGNFVGKFFWHDLEINIGSRFSDSFLKRMLNFANNVFLDDVDVSGHIVNKEKDSDISKFVLYYLFVQSLEKAFLLGLPKTYQTINHHESKFKGKVNINAFIRNDIPFTGKISSTSREQKEITEIIDVLFKAVKIISYSQFSTKNITHIKTHLKATKSQYFVSDETIKKALNSKTLQNPIFSPYKQVIEYAKIIIKNHSIEEKKSGNKECYGFIINVAELFEIYVTKLLQKSFPEWTVSSPKISLYDNPKLFFSRKIIPDIVMQKDNDVVVFDTKYKRMNYHGNSANGMGDLDRNDFFQINTYMTYYQQQGKKLLCGGLLYPLSSEHDLNICHAENWLGNTSVKFLIDGIKVDANTELLIKEEDNFIKRLTKVMTI